MRPAGYIVASVGALLMGALVVVLAPRLDALAQSANCVQGGPACPPVGASVNITIGGPGGGGGGGGPREQTQGDVRMEGWAYPGGIVTLLVDGGVAASFLAGTDGTFVRTIPNIPQGIHAFSAWGEDPEGRRSPTINVILSVAGGTTTVISGLVLPPTIAVGAPVAQGEPLTIRGYSFPGAYIYLFFASGAVPVAQVTAQVSGQWQYSVDTGILPPGVYEVRARAQAATGAQSEFSRTARFVVLPAGTEPIEPPFEPPQPPVDRPKDCSPDLNGDGRVNLVDFSILLYYWHQRVPHCADLNADGIVDLVDVSILMYWWTDALR